MKILSAILLLVMSYTAFAGVLDPLARIEAVNVLHAQSRAECSYRSMIIECESPSAFDALRDSGIIIYHTRGNMALACVPAHLLSGLDSWPSLMRATLSRLRNPSLDKARAVSKVDQVHEGTTLPKSYTGKGVIAGFSDVGFDPGHITFSGRVKALHHYIDTAGTAIHRTATPDIEAWTTDTRHQTHATHVAGILAGADSSTPYYGVAPDADIVATTSILHDVGILAGVEDVIAYAKDTGRPAVINLSLGSTIGPHDGTDALCRYLDMCAESDAAILVAAGNDGAENVYISKQFTPEDTILSTRLRSTFWTDVTIYSSVIDIWSNNDKPLKLRFRTYDKILEKYTYSSGWLTFNDNEILEFSENTDTEFGELYEGKILCTGELNPDNNRYNICISIATHSRAMLPDHPWSKYSLIIDVAGEPGTLANAFIGGNCDFTYGINNDQDIPSSDFSISSMACGFNTVSVGAAVSRNTTPTLAGDPQLWPDYQPETVATFTSYGTLDDGRTLPHFCAPGAMIVSALNRHYFRSYPEFASRIVAESLSVPENYYYADAGTSMATPHAAGIFALWLEADPTLTGPELREIAIATANHEGVDMTDPRSGAGMIDALAGLRHILSTQGIIDTEKYEELIEAYRNGERLVVKAGENARVQVYDLAGRPCSPDALPPAPVIVKITLPHTTVVRKI